VNILKLRSLGVVVNVDSIDFDCCFDSSYCCFECLDAIFRLRASFFV